MIDRNVLARYLAGDLSKEESDTVKAWLDRHPTLRARLAADAPLPEDYAELRDAGAASLMAQIRPHGERDESRPAEPEPSGTNRRSADSQAPSRRPDRPARTLLRRTRTTQVVMAVFALLVAAVAVRQLLLDNPEPAQYATAAGEQLEVGLPDGSTVNLNVASQLVVDPEFGATNRTVFLRGEAFFDVETNPNLPFVVVADAFDVEVLGTEFNVSAYEQEPVQSVAVAEGSVAVREGGPDRNDPSDAEGVARPKAAAERGEAVVLEAGQTAFIEGDAVRVLESDMNDVLAWREGKLVFRGAPLDVVERRLERWYGADIVIAADVADTLRLDATFENQPLGDAAGTIAAALGLTYEHTNNQLTFTRAQ